MRRGLAVVLTLSTFAVSASELGNQPSPEVCVQYAMTLISGTPTYMATQQEIVAELQERKEECTPQATFMEAASQRLRNLEAGRVLQAQYVADEERRVARQAEEQEQAEDDRVEKRNQRIRAAGRAWLQLQEQNRPQVTQCNTFAGTMTCTTR